MPRKKKYNTEEEKKEAHRLASEKYRKNNPEKIKDTQNKWHEKPENKEKCKKNTNKWRRDNPDKAKKINDKSNKKCREKPEYKEKKKQSNKRWYDKNKETHYENNKEYQKNWYIINREKVLSKQKEYRDTNPEKVKESKVKYKKNNPNRKKEEYKKQREENPHIIAWRGVLTNCLKRMGQKKEAYTIEILGYSALDIKNYISSLFTDGMTWDNWGEWHIDHIKRVIEFDKDTHPSIVNALSNLRPLWATSRVINGVFYEGNLNRG